MRRKEVDDAVVFGKMICPRLKTYSEWFMRTPRDAYMGSNVVRADFGSGLICPRAQTCCASPTRTPARLANSPGFKSFRCPRWRSKFSLERFSDRLRIRLRAQPLKNSAGRVPQAHRLSRALGLEMGNQCRKTTRVAHFSGSPLPFLRRKITSVIEARSQ